ncbi:ABC transporter permease [Methylomonas sp. HW2-6]|uniref:ABC transporter permease n=1 Tax=Methylomonas sp. HW2-6 TaxID=3376687 RepID=UPI0040434E6E
MKRKIVITPQKKLINLYIELWDHRDLLLILAWRDFKVRYKQTVIGASWAVLRPLLSMLIFTIVFNKIARLPTEGNTPYSLMVFTAMLPWYLFINSFNESANSIVENSTIVSKVYFPRIIIPSTSVFVNFIDFIISLFILFSIMAWHKLIPSTNIIYIPYFLLIAILYSLGLSYFVSALNVKYRDFRYIVPFISQIGLYLSPVGFSSQLIPEEWRMIYSINPMASVIDGFRWAIFGEGSNLYMPTLYVGTFVSISTFIVGMNYFLHAERKFADSL